MVLQPYKSQFIINAAKELFVRYGYSKTSLDDIAKEAQLGKGTIYYYFNSKEDIFIEVLELEFSKFIETFCAMINSEVSFESKLSVFIKTPIKMVYQNAPLLLDALRCISIPYLNRISDFRNANRGRLCSTLEEILECGMEEGKLNTNIPKEIITQIIFDWFLLGDSNLIICNPEVFVKKAEQDYDWIIQLLLQGLLKKG